MLGTTGYGKEKEWNFIFILHHTHKTIQNRLNAMSETVKLLEGNIGGNCMTWVWQWFLGY